MPTAFINIFNKTVLFVLKSALELKNIKQIMAKYYPLKHWLT